MEEYLKMNPILIVIKIKWNEIFGMLLANMQLHKNSGGSATECYYWQSLSSCLFKILLWTINVTEGRMQNPWGESHLRAAVSAKSMESLSRKQNFFTLVWLDYLIRIDKLCIIRKRIFLKIRMTCCLLTMVDITPCQGENTTICMYFKSRRFR